MARAGAVTRFLCPQERTEANGEQDQKPQDFGFVKLHLCKVRLIYCVAIGKYAPLVKQEAT
jgi:hypothetical protein